MQNSKTINEVVMLFIKIKINNMYIRAFIDTGAQFSLMSLLCAKKCNLEKQIDKSRPGLAKGIGYQLILGEIPKIKFQIENDVLISNIFISDGQPMDFILGLDIIKKYQCQIDVKNNVFRLGTTGTLTRFLRKDELPKYFQGSTPSQEFRDTKLLIKELNKRKANNRNKSNRTSKRRISESTNNSVSVNKKRLTINSNDKFTEQDVNDLIEIGFKRNDVIKELRKFDGDMNYAFKELIDKTLNSDLETSTTSKNESPFTSQSKIIEISNMKDENKTQQNKEIVNTEQNNNEKYVEKIVKFGFQRDDVIETLKKFNGDLDKAVEALVNKVFS